MAKATVKAYASSGCVLLTFDWASGNDRDVKYNMECWDEDDAEFAWDIDDFDAEDLAVVRGLQGGLSVKSG